MVCAAEQAVSSDQKSDRVVSSRTASPSTAVVEEKSLLSRLTEPLQAMAVRASVYASFVFAKQPKRIRQASFCSAAMRSAEMY